MARFTLALNEDLRVRFFSNIDRSGDCWVWTGGLDRAGYGRFNMRGKRQSAHRVSYWAQKGAIPSGLDIDHLCRNRACVNPAHLEAVTHAVNVRRGRTGKHWSERTHCAHDHPYDQANTRWVTHPTKGRYRVCRACAAAATKRWQDRQRHDDPTIDRPSSKEHT